MTLAVSVKNVSKQFGTLKALDDVSLNVNAGEFFGLLGPNGAGKTTLINSLAGLVKPDSGHITVMGFDVINNPFQARRHLGVVPQELVFDPFFTVRETLRLQSGYFSMGKNDVWIDEVLHHLGLTAQADQNMRALSGGMKRRVLVAQALVHRPSVIVLDEPTAGVDIELRHDLWRFIRNLNSQGHTIILTTHYLEEAEEQCHRIAMLKKGKIVALEKTSALLSTISGVMVKVRLAEGEIMPQGLPPHRVEGVFYVFALPGSGDAPGLLLKLAEAGCRTQDVEIMRPDLEQVFHRLVA